MKEASKQGIQTDAFFFFSGSASLTYANTAAVNDAMLE